MTRLDNFDKQRAARSLKGLWELLDADERQFLINNLRVERFKKNEIIYKEGDQPTNLLCLLSGKVKIYREGLGGRILINRVLRAVQYFGCRIRGECNCHRANACLVSSDG